jgi:predicted nucleic acid-binding Zn ribbon protein
MPTYVYKFLETGETVEVQQSFADDTLTEAVHPRTGATMAVRKVFQPVGVTFKGDGFYKTDSRASSKPGASTKGDTSSSESGSTGTTGSSTSTDTAGSGGDSKKSADTPSTTSPVTSTDSKSTGGSSTTPSSG